MVQNASEPINTCLKQRNAKYLPRRAQNELDVLGAKADTIEASRHDKHPVCMLKKL